MSASSAAENTKIANVTEAKRFLSGIISAKDDLQKLQSLVTKDIGPSEGGGITSIEELSRNCELDEFFGYGLFFAAIKLEGNPALDGVTIEQYGRAETFFANRIGHLDAQNKKDRLKIEQLNRYIDFAKRRKYLLERKQKATGWGFILGFFYGIILGALRSLFWGTVVTAVLSAIAILAYKAATRDWFTDINSLLPSFQPFDLNNILPLTQHALFNPLTWGFVVVSGLLIYSIVRFMYYGASYGADGAGKQFADELLSKSALLPQRAWRSKENAAITIEIEFISKRNPPATSASDSATGTRIIIGGDESKESSSMSFSANHDTNTVRPAANSSGQTHQAVHVKKKEAKEGSDRNSSSRSVSSAPAVVKDQEKKENGSQSSAASFAGVDFSKQSTTVRRIVPGVGVGNDDL